jgi:hypothetical protein
MDDLYVAYNAYRIVPDIDNRTNLIHTANYAILNGDERGFMALDLTYRMSTLN